MLISRLLRFALIADATATAATGLLMLVANQMLTAWLGIPATLLWYASLVLLPYAAIVGYLGTRTYVARAAVWFVIAANLAWALDSALLVASGWLDLTMLGYGFVIAQALVVAALAELQYLGLRQSSAVPSTEIATA
jgi:hypothetical protein